MLLLKKAEESAWAGKNPKDLNTWGLYQKLLSRLLGRLNEIQCTKTCCGAK